MRLTVYKHRKIAKTRDTCDYIAPIIGAAAISAGASIASGLGSLWSSSKNRKLQKQALEFQKQSWREEFDYTKWLNQETMNREDNALQRQVQDAQQAGISPLAVAGTGGSTSGALMSAPSAPSLTAPQYDYSGIQQGFQGISNAVLQMGKQASEEYIADQDRTQKKELALAELFQSADQFTATIGLENAKLANDYQKFVIAQNSENEKNRYESFLAFSKNLNDRGIPNYRVVDDDKYNTEYSKWAKSLSAYINGLSADSEAKSESENNAKSDNIDIAGGFGKGSGSTDSTSHAEGGKLLNGLKSVSDTILDSVTSNINISGKFGKGSSESSGTSSSETTVNTSKNQNLLHSWIMQNPMPVSFSEWKRGTFSKSNLDNNPYMF